MRRLVLLALAAASLALPALASAHPLGNFTVNRFSRIEVSGPRLYVRYVLDLAEIPTFQAGRIDAHAYATADRPQRAPRRRRTGGRTSSPSGAR